MPRLSGGGSAPGRAPQPPRRSQQHDGWLLTALSPPPAGVGIWQHDRVEIIANEQARRWGADGAG